LSLPLNISDTTSLCFSCGRCCFGPTRYVQVFDDDLATLGPELAGKFVVPAEENDRYMRMEEGHCAALDTSNGQFRCTIYEQRPLICRVYKMYGKQSLCPPEPLQTPHDLPRRAPELIAEG
jgi:Fe-S-cluster containining protein